MGRLWKISRLPLLELAADKSHEVRGALLKLLKARHPPEHTDALVTLASDTWTPDIRWDGRRIRFPIAEDAAEVLGSPPSQEARSHGEHRAGRGQRETQAAQCHRPAYRSQGVIGI